MLECYKPVRRRGRVYTVLILIGVVIVVLLISPLLRVKLRVGAGRTGEGVEQMGRKGVTKEKIFERLRVSGFFGNAQGKPELSHANIRRALGFSEPSVVRYMNELERERSGARRQHRP